MAIDLELRNVNIFVFKVGHITAQNAFIIYIRYCLREKIFNFLFS